MADTVRVVMRVGPEGARPRTWIIEDPETGEGLRLCPCPEGTAVSPALAAWLTDKANARLMGGRVFEVLAGASGADAAGTPVDADPVVELKAEVPAVDPDLGEGPKPAGEPEATASPEEIAEAVAAASARAKAKAASPNPQTDPGSGQRPGSTGKTAGR